MYYTQDSLEVTVGRKLTSTSTSCLSMFKHAQEKEQPELYTEI
jgi:hypothetical protein